MTEESEKEKFAKERLYLLKELENYECNNADKENLRHISNHENLKLLIKFKAKRETNRMYNQDLLKIKLRGPHKLHAKIFINELHIEQEAVDLSKCQKECPIIASNLLRTLAKVISKFSVTQRMPTEMERRCIVLTSAVIAFEIALLCDP